MTSWSSTPVTHGQAGPLLIFLLVGLLTVLGFVGAALYGLDSTGMLIWRHIKIRHGGR